MRKWTGWLLAVLLLLALAGCGSKTGASGSQTGAAGSQSSAGGGGGAYVDSGYGFAYGKYGLRVPGAAYTTQVSSDTQKVTVSAGAATESWVQLSADGTYVWHSQWDGKDYKGTWQKTEDKSWPILIPKAQEGKDWRLGKGTNSEIMLWDGNSTQYAGDRAK